MLLHQGLTTLTTYWLQQEPTKTHLDPTLGASLCKFEESVENYKHKGIVGGI